MPYKVPNVLSYSPFGHGGGLTKAVANLFGGGNQADAAKAQAYVDSQRAAAEYHLAQRDALDAKTRAEEQARLDLESAPRKVAGAIFGNQPQADLWMKSRETGSLPVAEFTTPVGSQMGPSQAQADVIPAQFDPNLVANATRMLTGIAAARALPGNDNLKHLSDIVGGLFNQEVRQGALNGTVTNPQIQRVGAATAATGGKALYNNLGEAGTFNQFTGEQGLNELGGAKVKLVGEQGKTEQSKQRKNNAQAGAASAQAGLRNEELKRLQADTLVPVLDPTTRTPMLGPDNKPIMIRASEQGKILQRGEDKRATQDNGATLKEPKGVQEKTPIAIKRRDLEAELLRLSGQSKIDDIDGAFANDMISQATTLAQTKGGEYWNNAPAAMRAVYDRVVGGRELKDKNAWTLRDSKFAPEGYRPAASTPPASVPNLPAPTRLMPPSSAPTTPGGLPAPKTKAEYDALPPGATYIGTDGQQKVKRGGDASGAVGT